MKGRSSMSSPLCAAMTTREHLCSLVRGVNILRSSGGYWPNGRDVAPNLRSVEGLFDEARNSLLFPVHEVDVAFDQRFGYPNWVRIDLTKGGGDHEMTLIASIKVIVP
jgi:hypothetical protein